MSTMYAARRRQGDWILSEWIRNMNLDWALHRSGQEGPPRLVYHDGWFRIVQGCPLTPGDGEYEAVQQTAARIRGDAEIPAAGETITS